LTSGDVEKTEQTLKILDKECQQYNVRYWNIASGEKKNQQSIKVWSYDSVNICLRPFYTMINNLRMLYNRDIKLRKELSKIMGIQMRIEATNDNLGENRKMIAEVVEYAEKEAPTGTYSVPEDYKKQERITEKDLK